MKRMIRAAINEDHLSGISFDFIVSDEGYEFNWMEVRFDRAFRKIGLELVGFDIREVDYSMYPEYADANIAQGGIDFKWIDDYNQSAIEETLASVLRDQGCELIGQPDFYSLEWTRE